MKIAIPIFDTKVSPRFDQTQAIFLVETEHAGVVASTSLETQGWPVNEKLKALLNLGVDILICGAIEYATLRYLSFNGVSVYSWVTGEVDDALACFLSNGMKPGIILGERGQMKGCWQFCQSKNHICHMFQTNLPRGEEEVSKMAKRDGKGRRGQGPRSGTGTAGRRPGKAGCGSGQGQGSKSARGKGCGRQRHRKNDHE